MKKKIVPLLLSISLVGTSLAESLAVFAESDTPVKAEYSFRKMKVNEMKTGKITSIDDNTISVLLAEKPEPPMPKDESDSSFDKNNKKTFKHPELSFSDETISITLDDSIKIKTDSSDDADISSLSVDSVVNLIYNDNNELIEISTKKFGGHNRQLDFNHKLGKITSIDNNTISVLLVEKPEIPMPKDESASSFDENDKKTFKRPELSFSDETISITLDDSIKIKTDSSDDADISSLSVDSVVNLIYNDNNELIEISTKKFGGHNRQRDFNHKLGKIISIDDNTISVLLAEKPETPMPKDEPASSFDENDKKNFKRPELSFSDETISITLNDSIKIKTDSSDDADISSLSIDSVVNLIYNDNNELIEIFSKNINMD